MNPDTTFNVTSWSARKRHLANAGATVTACGAGAIRPGENCAGHSHKPITQADIDALDLCKRCAR